MRRINPGHNHPLDELFKSSSHIAVLRALQHSKEGMSGRAVARATGINHQTSVNAVRNMESIGLIDRQGSGQSQLIRLNRESHIVTKLLLPLLTKEREMEEKILENIRKLLRGDLGRIARPYALSGTIFGSFARRENRAGSDLDFLVVVENNKAKDSLIQQSEGYQITLKKKFGIRLAQITLTLQEAKKRLREDDPLIKNILCEGIDVMPKKLREVIL